MAMKRLLPAENDDGPPRERKRPTLLSVGREVIKLQLMQRLLVPILEPVVRRVVREELENALLALIPSVPRPSINQIQAPRTVGHQLHFNSRLFRTLFSTSRISPVQVVIRSDKSEEPVTTGPLSSIRVEIVVLDGDFGRDGKVDWAKEDFAASVVRERDGRRPLLTGDLIIALREGVGTFHNITFTDNSSWTRSRRFRLGVRVVQSSGTEEKIREAMSESFIVKDHRGELYKKHDSPYPGDEVWRLKNIGRDGVFRRRLTDNGIKTVQQFLRFLVTDPSRLRSMLGTGMMSNKVWEETITHARKCILDDKSYMYFSAGREVGLLLNSIYEVEKVTFDDCQSFHSMDDLTPYQKQVVEKLKAQAYGNQKGIVDFNGPPFFGPSWPLPELLEPTSIPESSLGLQNPDLITHQILDFMHSTNPSPQGQLMVDLPQVKDITFMPDVHLRQLLAPMQSNSFNVLVVDQPQVENTVIPQGLQLSQPFSPNQSNTYIMNDLFQVQHGDSGNRWLASGSVRTVASDRHFLEYPQGQMLNWFNGSVQPK